MSVTTAIAALAEPIGFDLANGSDQQQADLFNGFARGWYSSMPSSIARDQQACYAVAKFSPQAKRLVLELAAYAGADS